MADLKLVCRDGLRSWIRRCPVELYTSAIESCSNWGDLRRYISSDHGSYLRVDSPALSVLRSVSEFISLTACDVGSNSYLSVHAGAQSEPSVDRRALVPLDLIGGDDRPAIGSPFKMFIIYYERALSS